jgi:Alkylmercury lyase
MSSSPPRTVEILYFDGCPNHAALESRLDGLLNRAGVATELELHRIDSEAEARRLRFLGSPTVRVDGRDVEPDAERREDYGLKCRLYRTAHGALVGQPSDELLLAALEHGLPGHGSQVPDRGSTLPADIFSGRSLSDRLDGCPSLYRDLHREVLRSFLGGWIPSGDELRQWAAELGIVLDDALAELQGRDVMWLDRDGDRVRVAYPFPGTSTRHHVELRDSGSQAFAMCAIDALGIPFMAGQVATIRSREETTGNEIEVRIDPAGTSEWDPPDTVVLTAVSGAGSSADYCCPHVNFASSRARALALMEKSSMQHADILEASEAIAVGRRIFGSLLRGT